MYFDEEAEEIHLNYPTLKILLRSCQDLCDKLNVPYDTDKIRVTTDYGRKVIIYYKPEDNN